VSTDAIRAADGDSPTTELVTGAVGDHCANCQTPLAADQRYCVNCGERRGRPRFSYDTLVAQTAPAAAAEPPAPTRPRSRFSSGTTLVAGVATLLIALGVGVLIGHDSNSSTPARGSAPQVITVGGGSGATAGTAANTGGAASTPAATGRSRGKSGKVKVTHLVVTGKTAKAATQAASKVLGSSQNLSNNAQQQVGSSCSGGAGCQNGTFTGNFFPGG
jgi:hypothetical protein